MGGGGKAQIFFGRGVSIWEIHTHRALGNLQQEERNTDANSYNATYKNVLML